MLLVPTKCQLQLSLVSRLSTPTDNCFPNSVAASPDRPAGRAVLLDALVWSKQLPTSMASLFTIPRAAEH
jgi:hypothetical protein